MAKSPQFPNLSSLDFFKIEKNASQNVPNNLYFGAWITMLYELRSRYNLHYDKWFLCPGQVSFAVFPTCMLKPIQQAVVGAWYPTLDPAFNSVVAKWSCYPGFNLGGGSPLKI